MTTQAGDVPKYPLRAARGDRVVLTAVATFTTDGAVSSLVADDPAITLGTFTSGDGALTFPKCDRAVIVASMVTADTVQSVYLTALDAAAGTATLTTDDAGTPTNPADTDKMLILLVLDGTPGL